MRETITVIARCGHPQTLEITYDGRRKAERAREIEFCQTNFQKIDCWECQRRQNKALQERLGFEIYWYTNKKVAHAVVLACRLLKMKPRKSPKSDSYYFFCKDCIFRISDHPWPLDRSLILREADFYDGRLFVTRLKPEAAHAWQELGKRDDIGPDNSQTGIVF